MKLEAYLAVPKFIVINSEDEVIGVDLGSGGYPFSAGSVQLAKIWNTRESAQQYCNTLPSEKLTVFELKTSIKTT